MRQSAPQIDFSPSRVKRSRGFPSKSRQVNLADRILSQFSDACLLVILFVAPLAFGGRHQLGATLFTTLCGLLAISWSYKQFWIGGGTWRTTPGYVLLIAIEGLVVLQLVKLPNTWITYLSPEISELLPLWSNNSDSPMSFGAWRTISLEPNATQLALAVLCGYAMLFVVMLQRLQTIEDIYKVLKWIALAAVAMAVFGLVQFVTSNGRYFWFYAMPYSNTLGEAKGSFTCRNHFAHFLALGVGPIVAYLLRNFSSRQSTSKSRDHRRNFSRQSHFSFSELIQNHSQNIALLFGLAIVILGVFLSFSRGGVGALAAAVLVGGFQLYWYRLVDGKHIFACLCLGVVLIGLLSFHGYEQLANRFEGASNIQDEGFFTGRLPVWNANIAAFQAGWLAGTGSGTHAAVYPIYLEHSTPTEFTHAENGYLQILTENGWIGAVLLGLVVMTCLTWCWRAVTRAIDSSHRIAAIAATSGIIASLLHSAFDFVWYIPACMSLTIILIACVARLSQMSAQRDEKPVGYRFHGRAFWLAATTAAVLITAWILGTSLGPARASVHWDRYLLASIQRQGLLEQHATGALSADQAKKLDAALINEMIRELQQTIAYHPEFGRAHLRLAGLYLRKFEAVQHASDNAMTVNQIRDAALASQFHSSKELKDWLDLAFEGNAKLLYHALAHARRATQLNPLQAESYMYQTSLCFLTGNSTKPIPSLLDQAIKVRPCDGEVLFDAGVQMLLLDDLDQAVSLWQKAFHESGSQDQQIIGILVETVPAAKFVEYFKPGWQSLQGLWRQYQTKGNPEDLPVVVDYGQKLLPTLQGKIKPPQLAFSYYAVAQMQLELQQSKQALANLRSAYQLNPDDYAIRRSFAATLITLGQPKEAEMHLRWCLGRQPDDDQLRATLSKLYKHKFSRQPIHVSQNL